MPAQAATTSISPGGWGGTIHLTMLTALSLGDSGHQSSVNFCRLRVGDSVATKKSLLSRYAETNCCQ
jgi:hypothetical protein